MIPRLTEIFIIEVVPRKVIPDFDSNYENDDEDSGRLKGAYVGSSLGPPVKWPLFKNGASQADALKIITKRVIKFPNDVHIFHGTPTENFAFPKGPAHFSRNPHYARLFAGGEKSARSIEYVTKGSPNLIKMPNFYPYHMFSHARSWLDLATGAEPSVIRGQHPDGGYDFTGKGGPFRVIGQMAMTRIAAQWLRSNGIDGIYMPQGEGHRGDDIVLVNPDKFIEPISVERHPK